MIQIAAPFAILILPLPWLWQACRSATPTVPRVALRLPFYNHLASTSPTTPQRWQRGCLLALWLLFIAALVRPQDIGAPIELARKGRGLMLAIDISGSMRMPDMLWQGRVTDRLTVVKAIAQQFLQRRQGDRLGLMLFGEQAYVQTPLTFDRQTVQYMLNDASVGLAGQATAIGDAIGLAIKRLLREDVQQRVVILLTDGANNAGAVAPIEVAKLAQHHGIRLYTIGLGSERVLVNGVFGPNVVNPSASLDQPMLKTVATMTGGKFFRATNTAELEAVYRELDAIEPTAADGGWYRPLTPLYHYPLGLCMSGIGLMLLWRLLLTLQPLPTLEVS